LRPPVKLIDDDASGERTDKLIRIIDDIYSNLGSVNRVTDIVRETLHIPTSGGGGGIGTISHNSLAGLVDGDPHTQYLYLDGRYGGQSIDGGTVAGDNLTITSTDHETKGHIYFGDTGAFIDFNEADERVGINAATTAAWKLRIHSTSDNEFFCTHQTDDAVGVTFLTYKQRGATTECNDDDEVFSLDNRFLNDNSEYVVGGEYKVVVDDITDTEEDSHIELHVVTAGSFTQILNIYGTYVGPAADGTINLGDSSYQWNNIYLDNQLISTLATGTAPMTIASTTLVTNLNADKVDSCDVIDEDNMASDSDAHIPTQQSVKAYVDAEVGGLSTDHGDLDGLADDDHSQYALLAGRSGGQTQYGGTAASDDYTISSTSNGTKGNIYFGASGAFITFDEANERIGLNASTSSAYKLRILSTSDYEILMTHQTNDADGALIRTYKERGSDTAANDADEVLVIDGMFLNDGTPKTYESAGKIVFQVDDVSDTTEDSHVEIHAMTGGTLTEALTINGDGVEIQGKVGFYGTTPVAQSNAYSVADLSADRSIDCDDSDLNETRNVLGTLITDLQATGIIG